MLALQILCFALWGCNTGLSVLPFTRALNSSHDGQTILVKTGDKIELDCSAVGCPGAEIFWYKFNKPVLDITYRKSKDMIKSKKLILDDILLADSGNYSCHMNNTLALFSRTFIVHVFESSKKHPILKVLLTNTTAILGGVASLRCLVTSDSVAYIRWYFKRYPVQVNDSNNSTQGDSKEITSILPVKVSSFETSNSNTHLFKGEAVYLIQKASFKDEGEYICEAFNQHSKVRHGAFLIVVKGPTPSAYEASVARYATLFGHTQGLPLAFLIAVPVFFLIILTAVFIRALEKVKQKHGVGLVKKIDLSEDAVLMEEACNGNKESAILKVEKDIVIPGTRWTPNYIKRDGVQNTDRHAAKLAYKVTCEAVPCSRDPLPSSRDSDVSSKRCSAALELEWEGIELEMGEGFKMIKMCKEEEV